MKTFIKDPTILSVHDFQNNERKFLGKFLFGFVIKDETNRFEPNFRAITSTIKSQNNLEFIAKSGNSYVTNDEPKCFDLTFVEFVVMGDRLCSPAEILERMSLTDVWGIGSKLGKRLNILGIKTAWEPANQSPKAMRSQFSVLVERTVNELNGMPCMSWDEVRQDKKEIFSTRSFGQRITEYNSLKAAITSHGCIVARKVRKQRSLIKRLLIFASSSPHDDNYYTKSLIYEFPVATDNSLKIAAGISVVFDQIFLSGVNFYRCGVGAIELENSQFQQQDMFNYSVNNPELMQCYDHINNRYGNGIIEVAAAGQREKWDMRRNFLSPGYTCKWRDIPKITC